MKAVANAGPLIALGKLGLVHLLKQPEGNLACHAGQHLELGRAYT